jgi:hypothetical protein
VTVSAIPAAVRTKILLHRPDLTDLVRRSEADPRAARAVARNYLRGETRLTIGETWDLAALAAGRGYGEQIG